MQKISEMTLNEAMASTFMILAILLQTIMWFTYPVIEVRESYWAVIIVLLWAAIISLTWPTKVSKRGV